MASCLLQDFIDYYNYPKKGYRTSSRYVGKCILLCLYTDHSFFNLISDSFPVNSYYKTQTDILQLHMYIHNFTTAA